MTESFDVLSCVGAGLCPGPGAFVLQSGELSLREGLKPQKLEHRHPVLLGHDVVQDGVDGSAEVEEDEGHKVAVLADLSNLQRAGLEGLGKQVSPHMEGQPAEDEGKHHHS